MTRTQSEGSAHEIHLNSLVDAANTSSWRHALNILMINGTVLVANENFNTPCLISQVGTIESIQKAMELLKARGEANIMPLLMEVIQCVAPEIFTGLKNVKAPTEETAVGFNVAATASLVSTIMPAIEKESSSLTGLVVDGAFKLSDLVAVWLITNFGKFRKNQITSGISDQDYELMIDDLRKLELIEPKLQTSLCPDCLNYELTISKYPSKKESCPRCGKPVVVTTLYLFKGQLGKIKSRNEDLPLFVSAFLKQKLPPTIFPNDKTSIYPLEQITFDDNGQKVKVEVDVRIPKLKLGIECKLFETPVAPMTTQRANSIASNLLKQIQGYVKVGINHVVIVTNLTEANLEKIDKAFKIQLRKSLLPIKYSLVSGNIDKLIEVLNSISVYINETIQENFNKTFENHPLKLESQITDEKAET